MLVMMGYSEHPDTSGHVFSASLRSLLMRLPFCNQSARETIGDWSIVDHPAVQPHRPVATVYMQAAPRLPVRAPAAAGVVESRSMWCLKTLDDGADDQGLMRRRGGRRRRLVRCYSQMVVDG